MATLLLVEDDSTIRQTLSSRLKKLGHDVLEAVDGREALDMVKTKKNIDLILLDLIMPRVSGFEFLEEAKLKLLLKQPILVLSNLDQATDVETAKNLGAVDYILKSNSSLQEISSKISKYLNQN